MRLLPLPFVVLTMLLLLGACDGDVEPGGGVTVSPTPAAPPESLAPPEPIEDGPLVIFLGDSLSAGLHEDSDKAFPAVLQRLLAAEGLPFRLVNAGVSGDTSAGGLRRVDWILKQEPDWVVIELGANDGLRGTPLDSVEENLRGIVERVRGAGAKPLLLGVRLPPNYGQDYTEGFFNLYQRIGEELDVPCVPFFLEGVGGVPELNHPDELHPNAKGHERIGEYLLPFFREELSAP